MRQMLSAAAISTAVLIGMGLLNSPNVLAQPKPVAEAQPADNKEPVPVRQVVLYSSGVGYFEHSGSVKGNTTTELHFKTAQINDILKSLVLQDLDKGRVGVITYPSQDPIAKTLRSFQVDITNNPSLSALLGQLRGAKVSVVTGAETVTGTILGVESRPKAVGGDKDGKGGQVINISFVNLITDAGIRGVSLDDVRTVTLADKKLQEELNRALAALAGARDQDKKPVQISLQGEGERRVRIGYVVETPVWKTSYRLMVSEAPKAKEAKAADPSGSLQGWAIVENQTDNDWSNVQLTLVSGRPISFIQDLYQPLYVPRPVVQPELYASLRPQTYDAGMGKALEQAAFKRDEQRQVDRMEKLQESQQSLRRAAAKDKAGEGVGGGGGSGGNLFGNGVAEAAIDPSSSVSSLASATKVGELFQYTVGSVTLPRQTSAMIPVVTDPVEVEKLSIYNLTVLPKNPLLGARVKNTTGKHLLQGPITVLDGGAYAGDARIDDLPPGQERLISYGVDQQINVQAKDNEQRSTLTAGKLIKGVLHLIYKEVITQEYVAENKGDADKTLVIEQARQGGDWKLVEPAKADETTDTLYRFKGKVAAGKGTQLTVKQEWVRGEEVRVLDLDVDAIVAYSKNGPLSEPVKDALTKAVTLRQAIAETERQIAQRQQKVAEVTQEQQRLRENMKTVSQNTDYYNRLLKKLDTQESQIESLQKEIVELSKKRDDQRKGFEDYTNGLSIE